jgi:conjugal transfer pilus assembly protein TraF
MNFVFHFLFARRGKILLCLAALCCSLAQADPQVKNWWLDTPRNDPERGYYWYPPDRPPEQKPEDQKQEKPTIYDMTEMADLKKELERLKDIAIMNPTEKNVLIFLQAQNFVYDKASLFADVSRRVIWANPDVNYNAKAPTVNFARARYDERQQAEREQTLRDLRDTHAILYFARSDCAYCADQSPILKGFSQNYGMRVLAVSLDGRPLHFFPDAKPDNGISMIASGGSGITTVPAIFLIDRRNQNIMPLGVGVIAGDELAERIRVLIHTQPGQEF